jgi:hypothetical protein
MVLDSYAVGELVGGCQRVIVWRGLLSLGAVWSDGALLDRKVGAAVQMAGEFHNDIVIGVDEIPGSGDSALSVTDDAVGELTLVGGED